MSSCAIRRSIATVVAAGAALAVMLAPPAAPGSVQACQSSGAVVSQASKRTVVKATLCLINTERKRRGLRALRLDPRLTRAAARHARDMARRDYFSHTSPSGSSPVDRVRRTGYLRAVRRGKVAEAIGWGREQRSTPRAIVRNWMKSPRHRTSILGRFREIGIGVERGAPVRVPDRAGTYAAEFGRRR